MFFYNSLLTDLLKLAFASDNTLEKRTHTEMIGNAKTTVTMYFRKDGSLHYLDAVSDYVPQENEEKSNQLQLELKQALEMENYLKAANLKKQLTELENKLQKAE